MTIIEQIKAEIERRKSLLTQHSKLTYNLILETFIKEYDDFLSFLSTLESEKPMNPEVAMKELDEKIALVKQRGTWDGVDVDKYMDEVRGREPEKPINQDGLEEEFNHYCFDFKDPDTGEDIPKNQISFSVEDALNVARHFAKWQKEQDTREMIMSDRSYFQKCYELGKKDILSKFTKKHLEGLKWIERTGISTQPVPYHKYCKDLYKVLEEILKEKYDTQGDTSI